MVCSRTDLDPNQGHCVPMDLMPDRGGTQEIMDVPGSARMKQYCVCERDTHIHTHTYTYTQDWGMTWNILSSCP